MHFINIQSCKLVFHMGSHHNPINTVAISPNGRHVAAIMDNGSINVYSIQSLTQELLKVTAPITADSLLKKCKRYLGKIYMCLLILCMSIQPLSSQVAVISSGEEDGELSKLKDRDRSAILQKTAKRSGRQRQAKIFTGFPVDDKEVGAKCTYAYFFPHIHDMPTM